jgi:hypothetical protein
MVYVSMQYVWSVMRKTNRSVPEVIRTNLHVLQTLRMKMCVIIDYVTLR